MTEVKKRNTIGRRKAASARVRLTAGTGKILVNNMECAKYFSNVEVEAIVTGALKAISKEKLYDISALVQGGGKKSQAESIRLGVARALVLEDETLKKTLKSQGFMTRDPRIKERKKFGLKKARKGPTWSKR